MDLQRRHVLPAVLLAAAAAVAVPALDRPEVGPPGSAHLHASLFLVVDGEPVNLSAGGTERVHMHRGDAVLHVHAEGVTVGRAFSALGIDVSRDCVAFEGRHCAAGNGTVTVLVDGEEIAPARAERRVIGQGDTITVFHGEDLAALPERFRDRTLPPAYRDRPRGTPV